MRRRGVIAVRAIVKDIKKYKGAYLIALPVLAWYFIFNYVPMYGAIIAFKQYSPAAGIWSSPWVGLKHFTEFFGSYYFGRLIRNTLSINVLGLLFAFPAPVLFALLLNELRSRLFKRSVQTITYIPHFISMVVISGMIIEFVKKDGLISLLAKSMFGGNSQNLLLNTALFRPIYIISDIWQNIGWGSIIYLAAIAAIDPELYEAAEIDGANRFRKALSITLPGIMPTLVILLILRIGSIMNVSFEKVMLLYNASIYETADVISTFTYRNGILQGNFSFATAVGLFNSVINCLMVIAANQISKKVTEQSLW